MVLTRGTARVGKVFGVLYVSGGSLFWLNSDVVSGSCNFICFLLAFGEEGDKSNCG